MSPSDEQKLRFVFEISEAVKLRWRRRTLIEFVEEVMAYLDSLPTFEGWKAELLNNMRHAVTCRHHHPWLERRLQALNRHAHSHPNRDSLVTQLARRVLLGEAARMKDVADAYPAFVDQLDRLYCGNITVGTIWDEAWCRVSSRLTRPSQEVT